MTYNEWRDELKSNLLSAPDGERRRVLEYYAEAYADRREAGFTEERIIEEFGAPYDAARRVLDIQSEPEPAPAPEPDIKPEGESAEGGSAIEIVDSKTGEPVKGEGKDKAPPAADADGAKKKRKLSKGKKALIIVGSILTGLFVSALIVFIVGLSLNDWQIVTDYETKEYTCAGEISALHVEGTAGEIDIELYDGDRAYIKYPTSKRFYVTVSEADGVLTVSGPGASFPFWGALNIPETVIKLPRAKVCDLNITVSSGDVELAAGTYGDCKFDVSAGKIEMGAVKCNTADIHVSTGSVEFRSLDCSDVKVDISTGAVEGGYVAANTVDIHVSTGSVELGIAGKKEEYTISVSKSTGSCNVSAQTGSTDKTIKIDISTGSVELDFKQ